MGTKHFRLLTGYAEAEDIYKVLCSMANNWEQVQINRVRIFFAGFTDVYISISASRWYHVSDANDPDWQGDVEDFLEECREIQKRTLRSFPQPERRWKGNWKEFNSADELAMYAGGRLAQLAVRRKQRRLAEAA